MGMGKGFPRCDGVSVCFGATFSAPSFLNTVVPGLTYITADMDSFINPGAKPWPSYLSASGFSLDRRILTFIGVVGGLLRFERPAIAITEAADDLQISMDFDPTPIASPSVCQDCLEPVSMTAIHPNLPSGQATWTYRRTSAPGVLGPCGFGRWESPDTDFCPNGFRVFHTPKLLRRNTILTSRFNVEITAIKAPDGLCTNFNRTYGPFTLFPLLNPFQDTDGWYHGFTQWNFGETFGPTSQNNASMRFELPVSIPGSGTFGGNCSDDPWEQCPIFDPFRTFCLPRLQISLNTGSFPFFIQRGSSEHRFINGAANKASLFDTDWSDLLFESGTDTGFCTDMTLGFQTLVFTE